MKKSDLMKNIQIATVEEVKNFEGRFPVSVTNMRILKENLTKHLSFELPNTKGFNDALFRMVSDYATKDRKVSTFVRHMKEEIREGFKLQYLTPEKLWLMYQEAYMRVEEDEWTNGIVTPAQGNVVEENYAPMPKDLLKRKGGDLN